MCRITSVHSFIVNISYVSKTYRSLSRWSSSLELVFGVLLWHASLSDGSKERLAYFWEDTLSHNSFLPSLPLGQPFCSLLSMGVCVLCLRAHFVSLLSSLPIAFDSLAMKHRWKSFFGWSLVALILFLVSFLLSCFAYMLSAASAGGGRHQGLIFFLFPSFSTSILRTSSAIFPSALGARGGHWQLLLWEVGDCPSQHCFV